MLNKKNICCTKKYLQLSRKRSYVIWSPYEIKKCTLICCLKIFICSHVRNVFSLCRKLYSVAWSEPVQYVQFVHSLVPTSLDKSRTICTVRAFTRTNQSRPEPVQYALFVHSLVPTSLDQSRYNLYCSCIHSYRPV